MLVLVLVIETTGVSFLITITNDVNHVLDKLYLQGTGARAPALPVIHRFLSLPRLLFSFFRGLIAAFADLMDAGLQSGAQLFFHLFFEAFDGCRLSHLPGILL